VSQVGYLRIVDYGLADTLPKPVPIAPRGSRRGERSADGQPSRR
jgi:hypothetical protein